MFEFEPTLDTVLDTDPNRFKTTQGIWFKGKLSGPDVSSELSIPDAEAKSIIEDYFVEASKNDSIYPIHLIPIVSGTASNRYYISVIDGNIKLRKQNKKGHPALSGEAYKTLFKRIQWSLTLDLLINHIGKIETFLHSDDKPDKETAEPLINALNLFVYVLKSHGVKVKSPTEGSGLKGRGL